MEFRRQLFIALSAGLALTACEPDPRARVAQMLKDSGAGDLTMASSGLLLQWFEEHPALAIEIDDLCSPSRPGYCASWPETARGRVCRAANQVAEFFEWQREIELKNDKATSEGNPDEQHV